jgi:hypothetical protein
LHTVIDAEGDPPDWSAPCSPHRPRWDNNISWRNTVAHFRPKAVARQEQSAQEELVGLVNVYGWPKDLDVVVTRTTFPLSGTIALRLPPELFDRWQAYEGHWSEGLSVMTATGEILITGEVSATLGGLPMRAAELATATLTFDALETGEAEVVLSAWIDGLGIGGVTYAWNTIDDEPPEVVAYVPGNGATDVPLRAPVVITFTEEIGPLTLDLIMTPTLAGLQQTWNEAGTVVTATHAGYLPDTAYLASVTASDGSANPVAIAKEWAFVTQAMWSIYLPMVLR